MKSTWTLKLVQRFVECFEKYPEKLWGIPISELTADWAPKRIKFRQKIAPFYENEWVAVGSRGTGAIYEFIATQITDGGGKLEFDKTLVSLGHEETELHTLSFQDGSEVAVAREDIVISSIPITLMARFLVTTATLNSEASVSPMSL